MESPLLALLIYEHSESFERLACILSDLSLECYGVRSWSAGKVVIHECQPLLLFVDLSVWSRSHDDIVATAAKSEHCMSVIVVGPLPDIEQYVSSIEQGAFNFMAPPFFHETLSPAVHSAITSARQRRISGPGATTLSRTAV